MTESASDIKFMQIALKYSEKGRGFTRSNPMVGAVVVRDKQILSVGYHKQYGDDHAEAMALKNLDAKGATIYVSLEPCAHFGNTPPCVDLLIKKKIKRVVIAVKDPNPVVSGKGIQKLEAHGIEVLVGVLEGQAKDLNRHYLTFHQKKRPFVALKAGISIDGKLTDKHGISEWITSKELREISHRMRGEYSGILAGKNTVLKDNPSLNIRSGIWEKKTFFRIILDASNSLNPDLKIFNRETNAPLIIFSSDKHKSSPKGDFHFFIGETGGKLHLKSVLNRLYELNISSILVEGGGEILNSFINEKLFDEVILFNSGSLTGGKDSVELFRGGFGISDSIYLKERKLYNLPNGYILRGIV